MQDFAYLKNYNFNQPLTVGFQSSFVWGTVNVAACFLLKNVRKWKLHILCELFNRLPTMKHLQQKGDLVKKCIKC